MNYITINDVADLLLPIFAVFSPHLLFIFSMMIAFSIAKFSKDIILR